MVDYVLSSIIIESITQKNMSLSNSQIKPNHSVDATGQSNHLLNFGFKQIICCTNRNIRVIIP